MISVLPESVLFKALSGFFLFCLVQYFSGLFRRILDLRRLLSQIILTICFGIVKIEPVTGVSFNDTRKGCALKLCRYEIPVEAKKNSPPEGEPWILNVMP